MASVPQRQYVGELKAWDLPRLEELEDQLTAEFAGRARLVFLEFERSGGQLHTLFLERLREMAGVAVNEILEYWFKGFGNGCNGESPELCIELPYLERAEGGDPLTLAYCVDNDDGSRTELIRVGLARVLCRILDSASMMNPSRIRVVASELRNLAKALEEASSPSGNGF